MVVSCGSPSRKSASEEPVVKAGKVEGAGGIRAAQKIAVHAPIVAAEAQIVLAVNPAQDSESEMVCDSEKLGCCSLNPVKLLSVTLGRP